MSEYLNFLKALGKPGRLPQATKSIRDCVQEAYPEALKWYFGQWNAGKHSREEVQKAAQNFQQDLYKTIFNKKSGLIRDSRGLIFLERALRLSESDQKNLKAWYYSIGECWAYRQGSAQPYCAIGQGTKVVLRGWVDPTNINWVETLYISTYHMASEKEIRLSDNPDTVVEVFEVLVQGRNILDTPYICRATADKYSHSPEVVAQLRQASGTARSGIQRADLRDIEYEKYKAWQNRIRGNDEEIINYPPSHGYRLVKKGLQYSLRNKQGDMVTDQWWDGISFVEDILKVRKGNRLYYTSSTKNGNSGLKAVGKYNFVSPKGRELLSSWVDNIHSDTQGNIYIQDRSKVWKVTADQIKNGVDLSNLEPISNVDIDWDDRDQLKESWLDYR